MLSGVDEFEKKMMDGGFFVKPISENLVLLEKWKMPIVYQKKEAWKIVCVEYSQETKLLLPYHN